MKVRGQMGSGLWQDGGARASQRPHCARHWPPLVTQTVARERERLDQQVAELGLTSEFSP